MVEISYVITDETQSRFHSGSRTTATLFKITIEITLGMGNKTMTVTVKLFNWLS